MRKSFFVILLLCMFPYMATAQEQVGTSVVDGKVVFLFSDGTWSLRDTSNPNCETLLAGVYFCNEENRWERTSDKDGDIAAQYRFDDRHYVQYVIEQIGSDDGVTLDFMRDIVIDNFASGAGVKKSAVQVIESEPLNSDGKTGETVVYAGKIDGLSVVFSNSIIIRPNLSVQVITFSVGTTFTDLHRSLHSEVLKATQIDR